VALVKTGSSTEILAGASTYTGGTTINAGTVRVNGQTGTNSGTGSGAVVVNSGGTLSGNGRIAGAVTVANSSTAVLYPNSSSTLDLGGNLTFGGSSGGVKFDLSSSAASGNDKVVLESKTLTCGGAQITINSAGTLDTTDYVLFDAGSSGTISGSFNATPVFVGTPPSYPAGFSIVTGTRYVTLHNSLPAYTLVITAAANTKTYDGTTSAAATPTLAGSLANGDTATLTEAYSDRNVGTGNKTLIPAVTITNSSNVNVTTNYTITLNSVSTGTISAKALTVSGITAGRRPFRRRRRRGPARRAMACLTRWTRFPRAR
jgi:autotransporter-associated beta strand protein